MNNYDQIAGWFEKQTPDSKAVAYLVYLAHVWHLALYDKPLIPNGAFSLEPGGLRILPTSGRWTPLKVETTDHLSRVWEAYKEFSYNELKALVQSDPVYQNALDKSSSVLATGIAKAYYSFIKNTIH